MAVAVKVEITPNETRPPRYPFSAELQYQSILIKLVNELKKLTLQELRKHGPDIIAQADIAYLRSDATTGAFGWSALLNDMLERIVAFLEPYLSTILEKIGDVSGTTNKIHQREWQRQVRQAYGRLASPQGPGQGPNNIVPFSRIGLRSERGVNPFAVNILNNQPNLAPILSAWEQQNLALIRSIPATTVEQLRGRFTDAFVGGTTLRDLTDIVVDRADVAKSRAALIARDQIGKLNGQLSEMRQKAAGINSYIWRTMGDERVRPKHRARNGKEYRWSDSGIKPGSEVRCLIPETMVDFSNGCRRLFRRKYAGNLSGFLMEDGSVFEATPNHPVLTFRGWLRADELELGDYVLKSVSDGVLIAERDHNGCQARIDDAFKALSVFGIGSVPGRKSDFHGDGSENDIDIIDFQRVLSTNDIAGIFESIGQFDFTVANELVSCDGALKEGVSAYGLPSGGHIGWSVQGQPLFGGHSGPSREHGFAFVSGVDSGLVNDSLDYVSSNAVFFGDHFYAQAGRMFADDFVGGDVDSIVCDNQGFPNGSVNAPSSQEFAEIVRVAGKDGGYLFQGSPLPYKAFRVINKFSRIFVGHVYNLETDTGWYVADAVVTHNCRCVSDPVFPTFKLTDN